MTLNAGMRQCCLHYEGRSGWSNDDRSETSNGEISEVKVFLHPWQSSHLKTKGDSEQRPLDTVLGLLF